MNVSADEQVVVLKPVIDKMRLTVPRAALAEKIHPNFDDDYWTNVEGLMKDAIKQDASLNSVRVDGYRCGVQIELECGGSVLFAVNSTRKNWPRMLIEFNPSKLPPEAAEEIALEWKCIEGGNLPLSALLGISRVARVDVAFDLINLRLADLYAFNSGTWKTWMCATDIGGVQTINFYKQSAKQSPHLAPTKRAELVIYDKRQEALDLNVVPEFGDRPHTRIEFCLTTKKLLPKLSTVSNPISGWQFRRAINCNPPFEQGRWLMFLDANRVRGFEAAADLLTDTERAALVPDKGDRFPLDLLPEGAWSHWPSTIEKSMVSEFAAWAAQPLYGVCPPPYGN